jgi:hypothetical protein
MIGLVEVCGLNGRLTKLFDLVDFIKATSLVVKGNRMCSTLSRTAIVQGAHYTRTYCFLEV